MKKERTNNRFARRLLVALMSLTVILGMMPAMGAYAEDPADGGTASAAENNTRWTQIYLPPAADAGEPYDAGTKPLSDILKEAMNFGIVTETFTLEGGDAETNVAAKVAKCTSQTGNDLTNDAVQTFIFGEVDDVFNIKGEDAIVKCTADDAAKIRALGSTRLTYQNDTKANLDAEVQGMIDNVINRSTAMAQTTPTATVTPNYSSQKYELDISDQPAGTYYVTIPDDMWSGDENGLYTMTTTQSDGTEISQKVNAISKENGKLQIKKNDNQTIIFNVPSSGDLSMEKFYINDQGADALTGSSGYDSAKTLIWNFPNASSLNIKGSVVGAIIAPEAAVNTAATSAGWLVSKSVTVTSGEWHNVNQKIKAPVVSNLSYKLNMSKSMGYPDNVTQNKISKIKGTITFRVYNSDKSQAVTSEKTVEVRGGTVSANVQFDESLPSGTLWLSKAFKPKLDQKL